MNRRFVVGLLAIGLLAGGAMLYVNGTNPGMAGACVRVGLLLVAVWLAYRDLERIPIWMLGSTLVAGAIIAWRPKLFLIVIPILIAFWFLRPRRGKQPPKRRALPGKHTVASKESRTRR